MTGKFSHRLATESDLEALREIMALSIATLQKGFLTEQQIAASTSVMGLDTQLIKDGTYFIIHSNDHIAGCGGWSFRNTLYGGDHSLDLRNPDVLNPATDAARIRAMYTHPDFARQGVGRLIIDLCEAAARDAGFLHTEMMATLSGEPLYRSCGYVPVENVVARGVDGTEVPLIRMQKKLGEA